MSAKSAREPEVKAFFDDNTFTLTYVVYDAETKDAVVIDPVLDFNPASAQTSTERVDELTEFLKTTGLKLHYVLETHAHADHLSSSQLLKERFDAPVAIGARIVEVQETFKGLLQLADDVPIDGSQFDHLIKDGETLEAGALRIEAISTPGHTPACLSFKIGELVFVGDAIFIEDYGTGRCDFPRGDASALYRSVKERLYTLPDSTRIFVGHDYMPQGRALRYETTIGKSKKSNIWLDGTTPHDEFVERRQKRDKTLAPPRLIFQAVQVNADAGRLPRPRANGHRYFNIPLNLFGPTDDIGNPAKK